MKPNEQLADKEEVFSSVIASLSQKMIQSLPERKAEYLREQLGTMNLQIFCDLENNTYCVSGKLEEVDKCRHKLSSLLDCENRNSDEGTSVTQDIHSENTHERINTVDTGINCDIIKAKRSVLSVSGRKRVKVDEGANLSPGKGIESNVATAKSKRGRSLKIPQRFSDLLVSKTDDIDVVDDEEHSTDNADSDFAPDSNLLVDTKEKKRRIKYTVEKSETDDAPVELEWLKSMRNVAQRKLKTKSENGENEAIDTAEAKNDDFPPKAFLKVKNNEQMGSEIDTLLANAKETRKGKPQTLSQLIRQQYETRMPYKFFCDKCSYKCKRESHFMRHMNLHKNNPPVHQCDKCSFTSIRKGVLNMHQLTHKPKNLLKCKECVYTTDDKFNLQRHIRKKHSVKVPESEKMTNKAMLGQQFILQGIKTLTSDTECTKYQCDSCEYTTSRKEHMVRHKRDVHTDLRPHLCDMCGASFKRIDALTQHKLTHLDRSKRNLPHTCYNCKKSFKSQAHLKEHLPVHSIQRPHLCDICGSAFKTRSVQKKHQNTIHFNPGSYRCSVCPKGFNTKYASQRHVRTHDADAANESAEQDESAPQPVDENATAIQTITIPADQLAQFTEQFQTVSQQLQSDVSEVYIQNIQSAADETFVHDQGDGVQQYYVTTDSGGNHTIVQIDGQSLEGQALIEQEDQGQTLIEQVEGQSLMHPVGQPSFKIQTEQGQTLVTLKSSDVENI